MESDETPPPLLDQAETQLAPPLEKSDTVQEPLQNQSGTAAVTAVPAAKKKVRGSAAAKQPKLPSLHESVKEGDEGSEGNSAGQIPGEKALEIPAEAASVARKTYFGVKSYLHQFYENRGEETPGGGEEDFHYLIRPKGRSCGAVLFKIGLITGATLFLLGAVAIIIGYAIPTQEEVRGETDDFKILDRNAMHFNRNLDMCKLAGLAMFCSGGLVLVISLLAPTFTSSYWEEDLAPEAFRLPINLSPIPEDEPRSPIPVTEKITGVQPPAIWTH